MNNYVNGKKVLAGVLALSVVCGCMAIPNSNDGILEINNSIVAGAENIVTPNTVKVYDNGFYFKALEDNTLEIVAYSGEDKELTIPSEIDGYKVTSIGKNAFEGCTSLTSIEIPDSVTSIGDFAFYRCTNLKNVINSNSIVYIGRLAFQSCTNLTNIEIPDSVINIGEQAFFDCTSLTSINVDKNNKKYSSKEGVLYNKNKTKLIRCPAGTKLTNIAIPNSITSIERSVFSGCTNLENIEIPNSVTSIENCAFKNCTSLISVKIPNSVTSIGMSVFEGCTSLKSIEIPSSVTADIGQRAFDDCTSLTSIIVDENSESYSSKDGVLYNKDKTELIRCPVGTKLTSIEIPNSVTSIRYGAFEDCTSLTNVKIPNSVACIKDRTFIYCENLKSIEIPNSVTSIEDCAFYGCESLETIKVPSSVTSIGMWAFEYCNNITDIYYHGTEEQWNEIDINHLDGSNGCLTSANIHYIDDVIDNNPTDDQTTDDQTTDIEEVVVGDVNGDDTVNTLDALCVLKYIVGLNDLTPEQQKTADTNKDGEINSSDALQILKFVVGLIKEF